MGEDEFHQVYNRRRQSLRNDEPTNEPLLTPSGTLFGNRVGDCSRARSSSWRRESSGNFERRRNRGEFNRRQTELPDNQTERWVQLRMSQPSVQYDFRKALGRREALGDLRMSTEKLLDFLCGKHAWTQKHVVRNVFEDLDRDVNLTDKILALNKENYARKSALYDPIENRARRDSLIQADTNRHATLQRRSMSQGRRNLVEDFQLDTMRENVKRLLDQLDVAKDRMKKENSEKNIEEEKMLKNRAHNARDKLVNAIMSSRSFDEGRIDLHTMNIECAKRIVCKRINANIHPPEFYVVTGQGLHSKDNICVIAGAIRDYLTLKNIQFKEGEGKNKGRIYIYPEPGLNPDCVIGKTPTNTRGWGQRPARIR